MELVVNNAEKKQINAAFMGKFTFSDSGTFRDFLGQVSALAPEQVELELANLSYVDSAALGMLLLLRDAAEKCGAKVVLKSPKGQVEKLLRLSRFDQIFSIAA